MMNEIEGLVHVTVAYMNALYTDEAEHNLDDIIRLVDEVSQLFTGCTPAVKHTAVNSLWNSMVAVADSDGLRRLAQ